MITSIHFQDFRVIENAELPLGPFNLLLGPNGSGKTTAVSAILAVGDAASATRCGAQPLVQPELAGATATFRFGETLAGGEATLRFDSTGRSSLAVIDPTGRTGSVLDWLVQGVRGYTLEPTALARSMPRESSGGLLPDGAGLSVVLAAMRRDDGRRWDAFVADFRRLLPEYSDVIAGETVDGLLAFSVATTRGQTLPAKNLSQGTLVILALLALVLAPERPPVVCLEEIERGIHPRLLRDVRDLLYRLSFPSDWGDARPAVQVITTTHSPYILDMFADTPEDVILAAKPLEGGGATFKRLSDVPELSALVQNGRLGDLWYSGIFGGVP